MPAAPSAVHFLFIQGARPVLLSQTRTTLNVREDKVRPSERTDRRDLTYPNRGLKLSLEQRRCLIGGEEHLQYGAKDQAL